MPLSFAATLATAPPKGSAKKGKALATTTRRRRAPGPSKLRFKLAKLSSGFLSRRPDVRVQIDVTAITADGRRFPLSLHSGSPGPLQAIALHDNQLRLKIPAKLRHPHGH